MSVGNLIPKRLHHNAYVTRDQEATRHFYEDIIGMPLVATWCESDELFGAVRTYCHTFFAMGDGGRWPSSSLPIRPRRSCSGRKCPSLPVITSPFRPPLSSGS